MAWSRCATETAGRKHRLASQQTASLFVDHGVGACKQRRWYDEAERLGSLEVDHQLILDRGLDRKLARHLPLEDAIDIARSKPKYIALLTSIGQQATLLSEETPRIDGRKIVTSSLQDDRSAMYVEEAIRYHDQSAIWLACVRRDDAIEFGRIAPHPLHVRR